MAEGDDLVSIGLDAVDAAEAKAAEGDDKKGDDDANNNNDDQAADDTKGSDDGVNSADDDGSDADGKKNSDDDDQAKGTDDDAAKDDQVADDDKVVTPPVEPEPVVDTSEFDKYTSAEDYVKDKLPEIEIRGSDGDDGEIKTFKVKSPMDLPDDFVPENHRDMLAASEKFGKNGAEAERLAKEYNDKVYDRVQLEAKTNLEKSWLSEIDTLIAEKRLQPITAAENTEAFAKDPAAQRISEISDFMIKENDRLAKANNPYRISSIRQALDLMEAQEQRTAADDAKVAADKAEADLVKKRGAMVGGGDSNPSKPQAPRVRPGDTIDDILARHDDLE